MGIAVLGVLWVWLGLKKLMRLGVGGKLGTAPLAIIVPSSCSWEFERQQSFCCLQKKKQQKQQKQQKKEKEEKLQQQGKHKHTMQKKRKSNKSSKSL